MEILKIGQEFVLSQDLPTQKEISGTPMIIKKGDKGVVTSRNCVEMISGEHRGCILPLSVAHFEVKGYDTENIAELIMSYLKGYFGSEIFETLEDFDVSKDDFKEQVTNVLDLVLKG